MANAKAARPRLTMQSMVLKRCREATAAAVAVTVAIAGDDVARSCALPFQLSADVCAPFRSPLRPITATRLGATPFLPANHPSHDPDRLLHTSTPLTALDWALEVAEFSFSSCDQRADRRSLPPRPRQGQLYEPT
jgi:hypothetical protein